MGFSKKVILTLVLSLFAVNAQAQYINPSPFGIPTLTLEDNFKVSCSNEEFSALKKLKHTDIAAYEYIVYLMLIECALDIRLWLVGETLE